MGRKVILVGVCALLGVASLAVAQTGWILVTPPIDEVRKRALPGDAGFQALSPSEQEAVAESLVRKDAPLTEWEPTAFDSARACEASRSRHVEETQHFRATAFIKAVGEILREFPELKSAPGPDPQPSQERIQQSRDRRRQLLDQMPPAIQRMIDESDREQERNVAEAKRHIYSMFIIPVVAAEQARLSRCVPASALYPAPR